MLIGNTRKSPRSRWPFTSRGTNAGIRASRRMGEQQVFEVRDTRTGAYMRVLVHRGVR
jgi:hypothetical protein